jgi:glycosyltransferase involved in cell wall biosynthesis
METRAADRDPVRFSVVIPTLNRTDLLRDTLESLKGCDPSPDEVILIDADPDNSARAVTADFTASLKPAVRYISSDPSLTVQRNRGIDASTGDVVVFLDDDVDIDDRLFGQLQNVYGDPTIVGATGRIIEPMPKRVGGPSSRLRRLLGRRSLEGTFTRFGYPRYLRNVDTERDVEHMFGCFMSARREAAAAVRFDESLAGYALAEDEDFSFRLSRLGRIRYLPQVVVHHRKLGFSSKDTREFGRLVVQNRWYLFRKNFRQTPLARLQFAVLLTLFVLHRLVNREWRGAWGLLEGVGRILRGRWAPSQ